MQAPHVVTFDDGSTEKVEADTRDQAKARARAPRVREIDPAGRMEKRDVNVHPRVKIARVETEEEYNARSAKAHGALRLVIFALLVGGALRLLDQLTGGALLGADAAPVAIAGCMWLVGAQGTAIGATIAPLTAVTGDSFQVPFFSEGKRAWLIQLWTDVQVAGTFRLRSPKFADNVNGQRYDTVIGDLAPLYPFGAKQPLFTGDVLIPELAGSAVGGDIEYALLLMYFEELAGQTMQGLTWDQLVNRVQDIVTVENTIATGATAAWGGAEAINAEVDQFQTRTSYAILGYVADTEAPAIAYRGPDTGNVRVGGPAEPGLRHVTAEWFVRLARFTGLPCIPVFQADNKAATFIDALQDENGADTTITTILARLRPA